MSNLIAGGFRPQAAQGGAQISIAIAISLGQGLNGGAGLGQPVGGFGMPQGGFPAGGPGGLGSFCGCGQQPNLGALGQNFGPQNPFQAGFQQGFQQAQMASKMKRLMRKLRKLMASMGNGPCGMNPGFGAPGMGGFPQTPRLF